MEIFGLLMGGDMNDAPTPNPPQPQQKKPDPTPQPAAKEEEEEDVEDLTPEELKKRQDKKLAVAAKERGNALYKEKNFEAALAGIDLCNIYDSSLSKFLSP